MHYLDNAATTRVHPAVAATAARVLEKHWANPSSLYGPGMEAEDIITEARKSLAAALGVPAGGPRQPSPIFTGSGTEANNIAILGAARARKNWGEHIVSTGFEHPSVANTLALLEEEGFRLTLAPPGPHGNVDTGAMLEAVGPKTVLVCAMRLNNETGAVVDAATLARAVKAKNGRTAFHCDAVQAFTKLPLGLQEGTIDTCAVSGHKLHAPKGVGALYIRPGFRLLPPLAGGHQEGGLRPGTENTAYIAAFAHAAKLATEENEAATKTIDALHARLRQGLAALGEVAVNSPDDAWPGILNFSLPGLQSQTLLNFLSAREVYVSSGSACDKGQPSPTLTAMGLPAARVNSALRASLCGQNTQEDIDALLAGLKEGLATLARA